MKILQNIQSEQNFGIECLKCYNNACNYYRFFFPLSFISKKECQTILHVDKGTWWPDKGDFPHSHNNNNNNSFVCLYSVTRAHSVLTVRKHC